MAAAAQRTVSIPPPAVLVVALVPLAAATDILGGYLTTLLRLPVFLDMIGTFVAAAILGPWWGAAVGVLANTGGVLVNGPSNLPFAVVNVAGALAWGYGIRSLGLARNPITFFGLNLVVALITAVIAAPIALFVLGGATGHASDAITAAIEATGRSVFDAVFTSNIIVSFADKLITGYVGLAIVRALPEHLSAGLRLPPADDGATLKRGIGGAVLLTFVGTAVGLAAAALYLALTAPAA